MTGATMLAAAGPTPSADISPYSTTYDGYGFIWGDLINPDSVDFYSGDMFIINLTALAAGTVTIGEYATDYVTLTESHSINVVNPEPMTIVLMGLGGLFLRRRK
jgi:hypothetical protein